MITLNLAGLRVKYLETYARNAHDLIYYWNAGVYSTTIDSQQQKVTVSGNIDSEILVKKLQKTGKHAEILNEKPLENSKKNEKQTTQIENQTPQKNEIKKMKSNKKGNQIQSPKPAQEDTGNGGKMKKGKEKKGNVMILTRYSTDWKYTIIYLLIEWSDCWKITYVWSHVGQSKKAWLTYDLNEQLLLFLLILE